MFFRSLILIIFSSTIVFSQSYWTELNSPVNTALRKCIFTDSLNGWAAGDDGVIIHTSNGGNTFIIQNSGITFYINDIFFLNKRLGWVVANEFLFSGTTILTTTNGGINWISRIFPDSTKFFRTIIFRDSLNGFLGGLGGAIYKTSDAGNTWNSSIVDTSEYSGFPISRFAFSSALTGFACGGYIDVAGVIWKTTDGGLRWSAAAYSPEPFYDFYVQNSERLICAGGDFEYGVQICKTSNSGNNWTYSSLQLFGQAYSIDYRTSSEAWMALGYSRNWAVSYDSGSTWVSIHVADSADLYSVDFSDSLHGWAVGDQGKILKYIPDVVNIEPLNSAAPGKLDLMQNYPNPFNPVTHIKFEISDPGFVALKIYDLLGKELAAPVNKIMISGKYSIEFDGSGLSSGIYFYSMEYTSEVNENKIHKETKKMLLIR